MLNENIENNLKLIRTKCSTEIIDYPIVDWTIEEGILRNTKTNFFSLGEFEDLKQSRHILIQQDEPALVGLLMCQVDGQRYFVLNLRSEPGLHNLTQFTSTIQSTPSNYLQKHGGKSTPYLQYFLPNFLNETIEVRHFSKQYDWGEYYLNKVKIFEVVEVNLMFELNENYHWVSENQLKNLLKEDFKVTTDLRAISFIALGLSNEEPPRSISTDDFCFSNQLKNLINLKPVNLELKSWKNNVNNELKIIFVRFNTLTREVDFWEQPLIKLNKAKEIQIFYTFINSEIFLALTTQTQIGLNSQKIIFPAKIEGFNHLKEKRITIRNSAEGGRFYQHEVNFHLIQLKSLVLQENVDWKNLDEVELICSESLRTSLELRMSLSVVRQLR